MKTYQCRRANKQTPGIQDLEDLGELNILKDGKSLLNELWPHDAVWNQLESIEADRADLAAIKLWLQTTFYNQSYLVSPDTGLSQRKCEMLWDESDSMIEVIESNGPCDDIVRIYRIDFDFDHGFHALLLSKVLVSDLPFKVTRLEFIEDNE